MDKSHKDSSDRGGVTRRGFLATVGTAAVAAAASGNASAEPGPSVIKAEDLAKITLVVNDRAHSVLVEPRWSLLFVLREKLGLTAAKEGCGRGECGACTVLIDGVPRYACMTLAVEAEGQKITTAEGLMTGEDLGPVQQAFVENDAFQCGYCTSGQTMSVEGLLRRNPHPSVDEIQRAVSGNLCRCGAYTNIFRAAHQAAELKTRKEGKP
jgi:xanthine dehydrogenase YagT iron-sulfur-binding subunit